jgi:hypothetical protein
VLWSSKWSFPSGFPTKTLDTFFFCLIHATCPTHRVLDLITQLKFDEYKSQCCALRNFPVSCYFLILIPTYFPLHPILEHPQPVMFFPLCGRPSCTRT